MVGFDESINVYKNLVKSATQDSINYKKRIDKAIEYIENISKEEVGVVAKEVLLNILKGAD